MDRVNARGPGAPRPLAVCHAKRRRSQTRPATSAGETTERGFNLQGFRSPIAQPLIGWVFFLALLLANSQVAEACVDPKALVPSTVSIARYFSDEERRADFGLLGMRGTAWFLSETSMVTAEHLATAMGLSDQSWRQIEVLGGENRQAIAVRILRIAGSNAEKLAVLELQAKFSGAQGLQIRSKPLVPEEQVVSLAYPGGRIRFVGGRFVRYGDSDKLAGTALLEMYDGDNRLALDHGASGAPIVDCEGRVVAIVSNIFTQTLQLPFRAMRISTAWGDPNVVSVPSQVLTDSFPP